MMHSHCARCTPRDSCTDANEFLVLALNGLPVMHSTNQHDTLGAGIVWSSGFLGSECRRTSQSPARALSAGAIHIWFW